MLGNKKENFVFLLLLYKIGYVLQCVSKLTLPSLALSFRSFR